MLLLDTSGLLAALFPDQARHAECARLLRDAARPLLLSPFVLAELDYLVARIGGVDKEAALLEDVGRGAYDLTGFDVADVQAALGVVRRHRDLDVGLTDASIVVLARRFGAVDLLTLDQWHFRVLTAGPRRPFRLLPFDA